MTVIYDLTDDINEDEWTVRECCLVVLNLLQTDNVRVGTGSSGWSGRAFGGRLGGRCWVAWGRFQLSLCTRPESWQNCRNALVCFSSLLLDLQIHFYTNFWTWRRDWEEALFIDRVINQILWIVLSGTWFSIHQSNLVALVPFLSLKGKLCLQLLLQNPNIKVRFH